MFGRLRQADEGSTSSVGLIVATAFFASAFIVAQLTVEHEGERDPFAATLDAQAASALSLIIEERGIATGAHNWAEDPDALTRFGLAQDNRTHFLDYDKIRKLRAGSQQESTVNGAPDYADVRAALGITQGDFHLRSYPVLMSIDDARWQPEEHLTLAYFAHYSGATAPASITTSSSTTSSELNVSVSITNEGLSDAVYMATIALGSQADDDTSRTAERHTRLLRPGETQTVWASFHALDSWVAPTGDVKVTLTDPYGNSAVDLSGNDIGNVWLTGLTPPTPAGATYNHAVYAANMYYVTGNTVEFVVDHYDEDGDHVTGAEARMVLIGPNGNEWVNETRPLETKKNGVTTFTCSNCTSVGNYTFIVWDTLVQRAQYEHVHVSAATMFTDKQNLAPVALREIGILSDLASSFDSTLYDATTNPDGDVYGDDTNQASDLVSHLDNYTTLVIGSEVSQTALAAAEVKYGIRDWVNAGGNLVVLGTHKQQSRWLEPVFHAAQETAGGGISAPDTTHPILNTPEHLDYERYLDRGRAWRIKDSAEFTHVLNRGSDGNSHQDTLAVSAPGAFNEGTVVLTSYMPGNLTSPQDNDEAKRLMHNLVTQGHSMLFIDYGPSLPQGVPIGSASRLVAVPHPNIPGVEVEVRLIFYLFG